MLKLACCLLTGNNDRKPAANQKEFYIRGANQQQAKRDFDENRLTNNSNVTLNCRPPMVSGMAAKQRQCMNVM
jgi:hypothetical protein